MDNFEAQGLLHEHLKQYRLRSYVELIALIDHPETCEVLGRSGTRYQVEIQSVWDSKKGGDIRVLGNIDDGGLRAFVPLSADFIMTPSGTFVGELPRRRGA